MFVYNKSGVQSNPVTTYVGYNKGVQSNQVTTYVSYNKSGVQSYFK